MRKTGKRWLAAFLCLMMALTLLPLQAFAAEADTAPAGVLAEFSKEGLAELSTGTMKVYVPFRNGSRRCYGKGERFRTGHHARCRPYGTHHQSHHD